MCFFTIAAGLVVNLSSAFAGSATWLANPGSGNWNTASNWTPGGPPNQPADVATFDSSTVTNLLVSATTQVGSITFNAGIETSYTISASTLAFLNSGITNNSGMTQNFVSLGLILFDNNASAGSNTVFTVTEGESEILFYHNSTAGSATFTINGSTQGDFSWGGSMSFEDTSSAQNATIIVNGSAFRHIENGFENPFPAGYLFLRSSAGNATLIANSGIGTGDGGVIRFQGQSTGGTARVKVFGNGNFDISNHDFPADVTIGSLEGDGVVFLGGHTLTIGSNDLSANFSGVLNDNNPSGTGPPSGLTKIGIGTLTLSGANTYTGATTINGGTLKVDGSLVSAVTISNGGTLGGAGGVRDVTVHSGGTVAPSGDQPLHINGQYMQEAGGVLKVVVTDANPGGAGQLEIAGNCTLDGTLEVRMNGWLPVQGQVFRLFHVSGDSTGSFAQTIFPDLRAGFQFQQDFVDGYFQITALNDGIPATGFLNISTRLQVGTGDNALIGGFIVTGTVPKKVILRAIGPSLAQSDVSNALADPTLELRDSAGGLLFANDNWMESAQVQEIIASGIPPAHEQEAAIVAMLAPGNYTAVMRGVNNTTGVGVVEAYDLAQAVPAKLANISTRGFVETGDNAMIGGFIAGNHAMHVMVRALGPSLTQVGVPNALDDPTVELHDGQGAVIAFNNDWQDTNAALIESTGIPPSNDRESAILATLSPGNYTAIVRGQNDTTGVGLVEFYDLH